MGSIKLKLIVVFMLLGIIGLTVLPITVNSQVDVNYSFDADVLFDIDNPTFDKTFDLENITVFTGIYNATFSFTNETGLTHTAIPFIDNTDLDWNVEVIDNFSGHDEVLFVERVGGGDVAHNPSIVGDGIIEFWILGDAVGAERSIIEIRQGGANDLMRVDYYDFGTLDIIHGDGVGGLTTVSTSVSNWTHIGLDFDVTADTFTAFVNGIEVVTDENFEFDNLATGVDIFDIFMSNGVKTYIDGVGFDWEGYTPGDNVVPLRNVSSQLQPGKHEFLWEGFNDPFEVGDSLPVIVTQFHEIDLSGAQVDIQLDPDDSNDRVVRVQADPTDPNGIELDTGLTFSEDAVNVSYTVSFTASNNPTEFCQIRVHSSDNTEVVRINYFPDLNVLNYFNGITTVALFNAITVNEKYTTNMFLDYTSDTVTISFSIDGVLEDIFLFNLLAEEKTGFTATDLITFSPVVDELIVEVDNSAIYRNGESLGTSFGYFVIDLNIGSWDLAQFNFFESSIAFGTEIQLAVVDDPYTVGESLTNIHNITFHNASFWNSLNVWVDVTVTNPFLLITTSSNITLGDFNPKAEGIILDDGTNQFPLQLNSSGVDPRISFFSLDVNNRLLFNKTSNDSNLEFIEALFDITDTSSAGKAIVFTSDKVGLASGFFRVNFTTVSDLFEITDLERTTRSTLTQNTTIGSLIVIITDIDDLTSGVTTGFVSGVSIIFSENIQIVILTLALIQMIIPLIIILTPTLAISSFVGRSAIVPVFILMSLLLTITSMIPLWLFFVIGLSNSAFIFLTKERGFE